MSPPVMSDYAISPFEKEHHLGIPVVGRSWPTMVKEQRLASAPVLVINLCSIFGGNGTHRMNLLTLTVNESIPRSKSSSYFGRIKADR